MDWQTLTTVLPTAVSASLYAAGQTTFLWTMLRRPKPPVPSSWPRVSILKPVSGVDDDLRGNLESFARLDYPDYEILIGIASPNDPAVPVVHEFIAANPGVSARVVWTRPAGGRVMNPKVAQLIDLTRRARGSVHVVSDANVRVPPTYLRAVVGELLRPGVGLVSSLIVGAGERTLGAALENAQMGAWVAPAVVSAHRLGLRPATVGKSMAMRAADLERVGGWESVAGVLAEDDVLAQRFHRAGYEVAVSLAPIENRNERGGVFRTLDRHARWGRMRRGLIPHIFFLEPLFMPMIVAGVVALAAPSALAFALFLHALGLQISGALLSLTLLRVRRAGRLAALEPLRALVTFGAWLLACASRKVVWRGNAFLVGKGSALSPVTREPEAAPGIAEL